MTTRTKQPASSGKAQKPPGPTAVERTVAKPARPKKAETAPKAARAKARPAEPAPAAPLSTPLPHPPLAKAPSPAPSGSADTPLPDFEALSRNAARLVEIGGKALAAYMKPMEEGRTNADLADSVGDAVKTFGKVAEYWLADPKRSLQAQSAITTGFIDLWSHALRRMGGEEAADLVPTEPGDKRFSDPQWQENPVFNFLRQAYSLTNTWANELVNHADAVDPATRDRAQFYLRQIAAPSRHPISSPPTPN